ncbi:MAG: Rha family transcriptional regulator [Kurthia sp.]|nr:Rha family transcriptional regulator [Candidatus Kurthia equi]
MGKLQLHETRQTISSLEVAEMVRRQHKDVMRDIRNIIEHLGGERKIAQSYFIESIYAN